MARKAMVVLGCAALALLMASAVSLPAEARHGGHGGHGGHGWHGGNGARMPFHSGHRFSGHFAPRHFHHRHFHHRHFHGGPVFLYGYDGYYGDGCYWLRRRAVYTGSAYWWRRYRACLAGYY
jgi:hypothetical protein